jgi:hypothetical protein
MSNSARRAVVACVLGGGMAIGSLAAVPALAQSCDSAYTSHCVPAFSEVGDLNCEYFYNQGISQIQLADPNNDPHGLDGWNYVDDGIGCEGAF